MKRFYWIESGRLAGCSQPGGDTASVEDDLNLLFDTGIRAIVSLTEKAVIAAGPDSTRFETLHLPIVDMTPPTQQQLDQAIAFIEAQLKDGRPVVVHCHAGLGRTGTVLAGWLIQQGVDAATAISQIRSICPGAIETPEQQTVLEHFSSTISRSV